MYVQQDLFAICIHKSTSSKFSPGLKLWVGFKEQFTNETFFTHKKQQEGWIHVAFGQTHRDDGAAKDLFSTAARLQFCLCCGWREEGLDCSTLASIEQRTARESKSYRNQPLTNKDEYQTY